VLDPEALTIGFARRFATYKRGDLIFRDPDRLDALLNDPDRPVQLILAGKAHPRDMAGKDIIKKIYQITRDPRFRKRVVFLEDYDINVARYLVQGVDVWLNNPRRPLEASGTSGMKAAANGALNLSVLDGWWCEAFNGENGWAIGSGEEYDDAEYQDEVESRALLDILETEVVPAFFRRSSDNLPKDWVARMKQSLRSVCSFFNSHRMVEEYMGDYYLPAAAMHRQLSEDDFEPVRRLREWLDRVRRHWDAVRFVETRFMGDRENPIGVPIRVQAVLELGGLTPDDVQVEAFFGKLDAHGRFESFDTAVLNDGTKEAAGQFTFTGDLRIGSTGKFGIRYRVRPVHPLLEPVLTLPFLRWNEV